MSIKQKRNDYLAKIARRGGRLVAFKTEDGREWCMRVPESRFFMDLHPNHDPQNLSGDSLKWLIAFYMRDRANRKYFIADYVFYSYLAGDPEPDDQYEARRILKQRMHSLSLDESNKNIWKYNTEV